jgi:hypothetical protein
VNRRLAAGAIVATMIALPGVAPATQTAPSLFHRPILVVDPNQSSNWSGYNQGSIELGGKLFNAISGAWIVPTASPHSPGEAEYSSSWIGIGGGCVDSGCTVTDTTLIQTGTEQDVDETGHASYSAWYEIIPAPSITISSMTIRAGDKMKAIIGEETPNSNVWTILIKDLTTGQSFNTTLPYSSTHLTAEWITETPVVVDGGGNVTIGPMPDLTHVHFAFARTNLQNANLQASETIQLVDPNSGQVIATPSTPSHGGTWFNDCTYATSCPAP